MTPTTKHSSLREVPLHFVRGALMGTFDVVPGVSGGTVALIVGIYERLLFSISAGAGMLVSLVRGRPRQARERWREIDWVLVIPLVIGIGTAIVTLARVIEPLLENYPVQMRGLFTGLIVASLVVPFSRIRQRSPMTAGAMFVAAVVAFVLTGLPSGGGTEPGLLAVLGAAAVALTAMILPGVSGAFLLVAMGMYEPTVAAVNARDLVYLGVFIIGGIVGLALMAKLLGWLLKAHHDLTMSVLFGLMVGSLRALWPWQDDARGLLAPTFDGTFLLAVALAAVGFVLVTVLVRLGRR